MSRDAVSTRRKGEIGEQAAASYLSLKGWTVLERNFHSPAGEIDIIAAKGDEVAFVEVKSWSTMPRAALERSIDGRKRWRIATTARFYLSRRPDLAERRLRFDVLFMGREAEDVLHIERAFDGGID
jgi:putative endonuclease